jgi:hypothetical protein
MVGNCELVIGFNTALILLNINEENISHQPFIQELKPIPLTPERLAKAGFEKHDNTYIMNDFIIEEQFDGTLHFSMWENLEYEGIDSHTITIRKNTLYVHQLQNLIFAISGEELNMQIPSQFIAQSTLSSSHKPKNN